MKINIKILKIIMLLCLFLITMGIIFNNYSFAAEPVPLENLSQNHTRKHQVELDSSGKAEVTYNWVGEMALVIEKVEKQPGDNTTPALPTVKKPATLSFTKLGTYKLRVICLQGAFRKWFDATVIVKEASAQGKTNTTNTTGKTNGIKEGGIQSQDLDLSDWNPINQPVDKTDDNKLVAVGNRIVGPLQVIGSLISVITIIIIGIKYMLGSVEEKAEYKATLYPYFLGAIIVFGITTILSIIYNFAISI